MAFWLSCKERILLYNGGNKRRLFLRVLYFQVGESMGFAKTRFKVMVKMGLSRHMFHHGHSNKLLN